ncbi:MAG: hypothetical protein ICV66_13735 [Chitinophagaceae bacterium]|nr:hypothetical protein [Chitinophagaceae bacterium]
MPFMLKNYLKIAFRNLSKHKLFSASVAAIITLLSKGFIRLIVIAGFIALPASYILGYFFLNLFANRVSVGICSLIFCFLGLLLLVLLIIGSQIYKVAIANPVKSLRTE